MKVLIPALAVCLLFATAAAAKNTAVAASITLDQANPALGTAVTFTTTVPKLAGNEYPMIAVSCYQDVNGDNFVDTSITGPDVVYTRLDHPAVTFTLGGYSSIWTGRGGGPAVCRADLDAYGFKGGQQSISVLASVSFDAAG